MTPELRKTELLLTKYTTYLDLTGEVWGVFRE